MPDKTPVTKKEKSAVMDSEMKKFGKGELHSGSKTGPVVKNRKQAIAIGLSVSGQSNKSAKQPHPPTNPGGYDDSAHEKRESEVMGAGYGPHEVAESASWGSMPANTTPHKFDRPPSKPSHGWGHPAPVRSGHLRMSGHAGGHRVGAKRGK